MSEHLPECNQRDTAWQKSYYSGVECVCDALRACEERVEESMDRAWTQTVKLAEAFAQRGYLDGHKDGYTAGVSAARDAVKNTPTDPRWNILQIQRAFLAAIDALKEKP